MLVNLITLLNIQLLWFPAGQGLKKGDFRDKISNVSEKTSNQNTYFTIPFKSTIHSQFIFDFFYRFISVMVLT